MGWREFQAWRRERMRSVRAHERLERTAPDSWAGYQADGWWAEQRQKADRMRGNA